ncbi:Hypothetical_protein [Hexamita inflata]|uniref:Hypothetical_protein n=1 Tax=Hexamita inflata TaxID=28002 RepID=A0ABP1GGJ7_9EUKA
MFGINLLVANKYQHLSYALLSSKNEDLSSICNYSISRGDTPIIGYCTKEQSLSNKNQKGNIIYSPSVITFHSLYTKKIQDLHIDFIYSIKKLPSFALFGLTSDIEVSQSNLSVKIPSQLAQGALLCFLCNVTAQSTDFAFIASAQNTSGLVLTSNAIYIENALIQFRLNAFNSGGLILNTMQTVMILKNCNISGFAINSSVSGSIIAFVRDPVTIQAQNVKNCANADFYGQNNFNQIILNGQIQINCVLCRENVPVYGICSNELEFGEQKDDQFVCKSTFVFDGEKCSCLEGEVVNGSKCVNILQSINAIYKQQEETNTKVIDLTHSTEELEKYIQILNNDRDQMKEQILNLQDLSESTIRSVESNSTQLQQYIIQNITEINTKIFRNMSVLDQRIYNNASLIINNIQTLNQTIIDINLAMTKLNSTLFDQQELSTILTQNISQLDQIQSVNNQTLLNHQQQLYSLNLQIQCLNSGYKFINNQCVISYNLTSTDYYTCLQNVYIPIFDLTVITHHINSIDPNKDYVFDSSTVVQSAFIKVTDNLYALTAIPLFQTQNVFNNIKIQLGQQKIDRWQLLTHQDTLSINQMNIISTGQISVSTLFNILIQESIQINVNNILVNLSVSTSSTGNITLISSISKDIKISGYQVLGNYVSTQIVALIGITVVEANINVNQVSFKPSIYEVGNCSSYLFSNVTYNSTLSFNNIAVFIGNETQIKLLGSIESTDFDKHYYQFGGIIANLNSSSTVVVNQYINDCSQKFSTYYVTYTGFIIGYGQDSLSQIEICNVCMQQNLNSEKAKAFHSIGLVGWNYGNIQVQQASVTLTVNCILISNFGLIGGQRYLESVQNIAKVSNVKTFVNAESQNGKHIGSVFGTEGAYNCSMINVFASCNVTVNDFVGGFVGWQYPNSNLTIQSSQIQFSTMQSQITTGGLIGIQNTDSNATVIDTYISNINIYGQNVGGVTGSCQYNLVLINSKIELVYISGLYPGILVGLNNSVYSVTNSHQLKNQIQGYESTDCELSSTWSIFQCS